MAHRSSRESRPFLLRAATSQQREPSPSLTAASYTPLAYLFREWPPWAIRDALHGLPTGKLALVAATCHDPPVLLLDEPDDALDAAAIADLRALLVAWRDEGRTVLLSTHHTQALQLPFDGRLEVAERRVRHA